ncbi:MAG: diadenylate cyclase [Bacteroidales bacterium]|nr:diadenylate cyclase [Bacteroidales bacterium]
MITAFISLRILDIFDIFLVALIFYQVYQWIKTSIAINIFIGIFAIYLFWLLVKALKMQLLTTILGQFMGVGVIAIIIVFQQEIRRFFLHIGTKYFSKGSKFSLDYILSGDLFKSNNANKQEIMKACWALSREKMGALIVITNKSELSSFSETGDYINADINANLIEAIFFKNSPLHDGAMLIVRNKILAARCTLPINHDIKLPSNYGMRHLSAVSMNYQTNTLVITVSEETGQISYVWEGKIHPVYSEQDFNIAFSQDF